MNPLISAAELQARRAGTVIIDCRFSLSDTDAGRRHYIEGHIPGAHYLHLDEDLCGEKVLYGGRHPLPDTQTFCRRLADLGITTDTPVVAYDDSGFVPAARFWWMMRSAGYRDVRVLNGGLTAWKDVVGEISTEIPENIRVVPHARQAFSRCIDFEGVRRAQARGALLIDSREERRYQGLEEPIDPVAGHIPGALNFPWQGVTEDTGMALPARQFERWQPLWDESLVVYCGSGVTACVNLLSLAIVGRDDTQLYVGSWSDWCARLEE